LVKRSSWLTKNPVKLELHVYEIKGLGHLMNNFKSVLSVHVQMVPNFQVTKVKEKVI
jgi:hypothetical protein